MEKKAIRRRKPKVRRLQNWDVEDLAPQANEGPHNSGNQPERSTDESDEDLHEEYPNQTLVPTTSTPHHDRGRDSEILRLLEQSLNRTIPSVSLKVAASAVAPCTPFAKDSELTTSEWEAWKRKFESWCETNEIMNQREMQLNFNFMAGTHIERILETAPGTQDELKWYSETAQVLDNYFRGRANDYALCNSFRNTAQMKNEKNREFVERVLRAALRFMSRSDPMINREVFLVVAQHADCKKLQAFAMSPKDPAKPSYDDLVNHARILDNQNELRDQAVRRAEKSKKECEILEVSEQYTQRHQYNPTKQAQTKRLSVPKRYQGDPKVAPDGCFRCGAKDHLASSCTISKNPCGYCGKIGHTEHVCRSKARALASGTFKENTKTSSETDSTGTTENVISN